MVSGTLAPLYSFWVKVGLKRGSGPDRGRSPVEWGDFPFVRPSVRPSVRPFPPSRAQEPARQALDPSSQASEPASHGSKALMDEQKISPFYRTSSPIGAAAPLQPNQKTIKRGKGTADHMMPLGAWFHI